MCRTCAEAQVYVAVILLLLLALVLLLWGAFGFGELVKQLCVGVGNSYNYFLRVSELFCRFEDSKLFQRVESSRYAGSFDAVCSCLSLCSF